MLVANKKHIPETLNESGARRIAKKIEAYWRANGDNRVVCRVVPGNNSDIAGNHDRLFYVRSNLVNGLPPVFRLPKPLNRDAA